MLVLLSSIPIQYALKIHATVRTDFNIVRYSCLLFLLTIRYKYNVIPNVLFFIICMQFLYA